MGGNKSLQLLHVWKIVISFLTYLNKPLFWAKKDLTKFSFQAKLFNKVALRIQQEAAFICDENLHIKGSSAFFF